MRAHQSAKRPDEPNVPVSLPSWTWACSGQRARPIGPSVSRAAAPAAVGARRFHRWASLLATLALACFPVTAGSAPAGTAPEATALAMSGAAPHMDHSPKHGGI